MSNYKRYQKVQRNGFKRYIQRDKVIITPKIDGTNAKIFYDDEIGIVCGSRNRALYKEEPDNQGFRQHIIVDGYQPAFDFFEETANRKYSIFGEWLKKHSVEYKKEYYNELYVYDLYDNEAERYVDYEEVLELLVPYGFTMVPILGKFEKEKDISEEMIREYLDLAGNYLEPTLGFAEGIVLKDYAEPNQEWTKVIDERFYIRGNTKKPKPTAIADGIESLIMEDFFTSHFIDKELDRGLEEYSTLDNPRAAIGKIMFRTKQVFFEEEILNILKKYKKTNLIINFKQLYKLMDDAMRPSLLKKIEDKSN